MGSGVKLKREENKPTGAAYPHGSRVHTRYYTAPKAMRLSQTSLLVVLGLDGDIRDHNSRHKRDTILHTHTIFITDPPCE